MDGRAALRWPRDYQGEYTFRLLTELGFVSRPYDIKVFGDLTADPEVLKKMRFLHPVDLLISPNNTAWEQMAFPQACRGAAFIHAIGGRGPALTRIPQVFTMFGLGEDNSTRRRRAVQKAPALFVVSQHTKQQLLASLSVPEAQIVVTPPAAIVPTAKPTPAVASETEPYLLAAVDWPFEAMLSGLFDLIEAIPDFGNISVTVLTSQGRTAAALARAAAHRGSGSRVTAVVPKTDEEVAALYHQAAALVTLGGGDGEMMAALNAMASGKPVLARNGLPDIPPDLIWRLPDDSAEAARRIRDFLLSEDRQEPRAEKAGDFVSALSWKRTAAEAHQTYCTLLEQSHRL